MIQQLTARHSNNGRARLMPALAVVTLLGAVPGAAVPRHRDAADKTGAAAVISEDSEVKMGRVAAEENDKTVRLVTDAALVERVNRIGQELAAAANKNPTTALWGSSQLKQFQYTFKIVDDKDINAFSLPGGYIYINKGLLDYVHSDDELAGVLAHEITHAAHHHMVKLIHEQSKIQNVLLPAMAALVLMSRGGMSNAGTALLAGQLYTTAKLNTYGVEAEKDADHGGILLMTRTKYNPAGMYSFMLRLAAEERRHGPIELGIYRTHPPGGERVEAARKDLEALHVPIELSKVDPAERVTVTLNKGGASGRDIAELKMRDLVLCKVVAADDMTAEERGAKIAAELTHMFDNHLQNFEVRLNADKTKVVVRGTTIMTEEDARAQQKPLRELAQSMSQTISLVSLKHQSEAANF